MRALLILALGAALVSPTFAAEESRQSRQLAREADRTEADRGRWQQPDGTLHADRMQRLRSACGRDFEQPRVGMPLERAKACVGDLVFVGDMVYSRGNVGIYLAGRHKLHVQHGKVIAWRSL